MVLQVLTLHQKYESLHDQTSDIKAKVEDVREQAAHRFASEVERLEDQNEMLFSAWSEDLKEELELKHRQLNEKFYGEQLALEIRLQHVEEVQAPSVLSGKRDDNLDSERIHVQVDSMY